MTALFKCEIRSLINIYLKSSVRECSCADSQSISFISSTVMPSVWDNGRRLISPNIISLFSKKRCAKYK